MGADPLDRVRSAMRPSRTVKEVGPDSVGRALRRMAEDLVTERRRVVLLQRENRELKTELEELRRLVEQQRAPAPGAAHD
jgi:3-polyprenyl-4-hydroxybenzoate decarboxylase